MMRTLVAAAALSLFGLPAAAQAATCTGNCGSSGPDGSVTVAPTGDGTYNWVSTWLGQDGAAQIDGYSGAATNGSELLSDAFFASQGSQVAFWFNYVTSDGSGYADYGFAQLINAETGAVAANLFTARTRPSGTIVPGIDMPPVEATLSPATVPIIPGAPTWSPLGDSSESCYAAGCGYTGWIYSTYDIQTSGSYQLRFGAANWSDTAYDTGLAFSGLLLNGAVIGDGSSPDDPLLPGVIGPNGEFEFTFTPTPQQPVFIDPEYAIGYTYEVTSGNNTITSVILQNLSFDTDGYDIYALDGVTLLASGVLTYDFGLTGVLGFIVKDIDYTATTGVDPTDPTGFVTGLTFANAVQTTVTQTPIIVNVPGTGAVPEPATWAMMILGFGFVGGALRRQRQAVRVRFA